MIQFNSWIKRIAFVSSILFFTNTTEAQQDRLISDTLTLDNVFAGVANNNPLIKQLGEVVNSSELSVEMAKTAYLPTVDINSTYSRMDPIPSFDIPQFGHMQMYPDNSINIALEVREMIYDFGKTGKSVEVQKANKELAELSADQLKQKLLLSSAGLFYTIYYLQNAIYIIDSHLNTLKKHLEFVNNKQKTGSATEYEILSTQVKVSATETQLSELQTAYEVQLLHLKTIMNIETKNLFLVADTSICNTIEFSDSVFSYASVHRNDLLMLEKKQSAANLNYRLAQIENLPTLAAFGTGGWKNGYISDIEALKPNYVVGLSFKVSLFDGNRRIVKLHLANSAINQLSYEKENTTNTVFDEINENYAQLQLSLKKVEMSKIQVEQAKDAFNRAEVNFREGVITNLDLLYASDMLSDSELMLLKNKMDYQFNVLKYKSALGDRLYQ